MRISRRDSPRRCVSGYKSNGCRTDVSRLAPLIELSRICRVSTELLEPALRQCRLERPAPLRPRQRSRRWELQAQQLRARRLRQQQARSHQQEQRLAELRPVRRLPPSHLRLRERLR